MQIASFEKRLFAYLVDYLLVVACSIVLFLFVFVKAWHLPSYTWFIFVPTMASLFYILFVGNITYFTNGISLGNAIFHLKMVSIKFQKLSYKQVMIKFLPMSLWPCCLVNAFYMLFKHTEKTVFDELSHTVSVSIK